MGVEAQEAVGAETAKDSTVVDVVEEPPFLKATVAAGAAGGD